jgi:hypothetical protein
MGLACENLHSSGHCYVSLRVEAPPVFKWRRTSAALTVCHVAAHAAISELTLFAAVAMRAATASGFEI